MDGRMDGWMNGWQMDEELVDGRVGEYIYGTDGWMDGRTDG